MDEKNKMEVFINGKVFILHGDEQEEYFQKLGRYLDKKITEAKKVKPIRASNIDLNTLYVLINIADDMFKQQDAAEELEQRLEEKEAELEMYIDEVSKLTEENLMLRDKLSEYQINYNNVKKELSEFINTFDTEHKKGPHGRK